MISVPSLLSLTHLLGLVLGVGAATAKLVLLLKCAADHTFVPAYIMVVRPVTKLIVLGLILLTLSGIGWLLVGYSFTPQLIVKLVLVGVVWVLGPVIDNVFEPKFIKLAPASGESPSSAFVVARKQYLILEIVADALFYFIIVMWVLV